LEKRAATSFAIFASGARSAERGGNNLEDFNNLEDRLSHFRASGARSAQRGGINLEDFRAENGSSEAKMTQAARALPSEKGTTYKVVKTFVQKMCQAKARIWP